MTATLPSSFRPDDAHTHPLLRSPLLRRVEREFSHLPLMERAGAAVAEWASSLRLDRDAPIVIFAGPGNNGGDALVAARLLREQGVAVAVICSQPPSSRPHASPDALQACQRFLDAGGRFADVVPEQASLVIDGLFGIGLQRAIAPPYAEQLATLQALAAAARCPLLALDTPSGLDADTGHCTGPAVRATHTLTFLADKPGLHTADGPDHAGDVRVAPLGIDLAAWPPLQDEANAINAGRCLGRDGFAACLTPRPNNSHKGTFGSAGILGGNCSMVGAALLAGRAALKLGSGRVYLGLLDPRAPTVDPLQPELMFRTPEVLLTAPLTALACGPGLGQDAAAQGTLKTALGTALPLVLDADALNLLAADPLLQQALANRQAPVVLTPHPTEAARLLGQTTTAIQADRIAAACAMARNTRAWVALKGCGTVIANPPGQWWVNPTGHPALATAGTGDVLTGMIAAFLAQGWPLPQALHGAVFLHGAAAQAAVRNADLASGLTASELIDHARRLRNHWTGS